MNRAIVSSLLAFAATACSAPEKACQFWETGVALGRLTPHNEPVMFVHYVCSRAEGRIEIRTDYVDLHGTKWSLSELELASAFVTNSQGERMTDQEILTVYADYRDLIGRFAICNEIVPKPGWFQGGCE